MTNQPPSITQEYDLIKASLNEKQRRLYLWAKAKCHGKWWVEYIANLFWVSTNTVRKGKKEIEEWDWIEYGNRIRKTWWWRKKTIAKNPEIAIQIEKELDGNTIWNPESLLTWTTKSLNKLKDGIFQWLWLLVGIDVIARFLHENNYSLQMNKKMIEWWNHEDRDEQFVYIKTKSEDFIDKGLPVLSVDTKKKELVWNFKNPWKVRTKKWEWKEVSVYDFPSLAKGKAVPYWVYDVMQNKGWVSVWVSADTGEFSVQAIRSWRENMGKEQYENATDIYINCDWWWSNGSRCRLRKVELQTLANELKKNIHVSHFPPWTSKRNKIEHRLFCHISNNRKGMPLEDFVTVVNLIGGTTTSKWLIVKCSLDEKIYQKWIKITDKELSQLNIKKDEFHWEWNYTICPQNN